MIGITGATGQLGQLTIKHLLTKKSADSLITLHILADHEHPFWPMVNTNSGAS